MIRVIGGDGDGAEGRDYDDAVDDAGEIFRRLLFPLRLGPASSRNNFRFLRQRLHSMPPGLEMRRLIASAH